MRIERHLFSLSRDLEFFELRTLRSATGQDERSFGRVILKELIDNALDACEGAGVPPRLDVAISVGGDACTFTVLDNGPGLSGEDVARVLDFRSFTSSKAEYRAPTRGAQGNALKTVLGIPVALASDPSRVTPLVIESRGTRYTVTVRLNRQIGKVDIAVETAPTAEPGTRFTVTTELPERPDLLRYRDLVRDFSAFNPHAAFSFTADGETVEFPATRPDFRKFMPSDLTSAHWYTSADFARLVHAHVSNGHDRPLRAFVAEFRGLSRTAGQIARDTGVSRLSDLDAEDPRVLALLERMQAAAPGPSPGVLGVLGERHFEAFLKPDPGAFWYKKMDGAFDLEGATIPYVLEMAVAYNAKEHVELLVGVNHSVTYSNPFDVTEWMQVSRGRDSWGGYGFSGLLSKFKVEDDDPITLAVHLVCPNLQYTDRSKSRFNARPFLNALAEATYHTCKAHYREKKRQEREARVSRPFWRLPRRVILKDAVFRVLPQAVAVVSDGGRLPFSARNLFYQVRPLLQPITEKELSYDYFTPPLLTEYQELHGPIPGLYYDPRGVLIHPHEEGQRPLGTQEVEAYESPGYRYNKVLYVEKKGLLPVLKSARLADRYDTAVIAGEGYATRAIKSLIDSMGDDQELRFFCVHDADVDGVQIARTLQEATRTAGRRKVEIVDLGLRPKEAWDMDLQPEAVNLKKKPSESLSEVLSEEEYEWLKGNGRTGQRIELNAMPPRQFLEWLEGKLRAHGATGKVIPPEEVVGGRFEQTAEEKLRAEVDRLVLEGISDLLGVSLDSLTDRAFARLRQSITADGCYSGLRNHLADNPPESWDAYTDLQAEAAVVELTRAPDTGRLIRQILENATGIKQGEC